MKRNTLLLVTLLILLVGIYFLFVYESPGEENLFHVDNKDDIRKVVLTKVVKGEQKGTLELEYIDNEWKINGKYTAIQSKADDFMQLLTSIRVKNPIEKKGQESALAIIKLNHTLVSIYDAKGKVLREYFVGSTNNQQTGNIMLVRGASVPYVVSRPGHEGYVSVYYSTNAEDWREKLLFNITGDELSEVKAEYTHREDGFHLKRTAPGEGFVLADQSQVDQQRMDAYLKLFTGKIYAESFADEFFPEMGDSLRKRVPDVIFSVNSYKGSEVAVELFVRPENVNNFFAFIRGKKELMTVQHHVIDPFLKSDAFFRVTASPDI